MPFPSQPASGPRAHRPRYPLPSLSRCGAPAVGHHDPPVPPARRRDQRRHLCASGPGPGAGVRRHPRDPGAAGRVRHLRGADARHARCGAGAGYRWAAACARRPRPDCRGLEPPPALHRQGRGPPRALLRAAAAHRRGAGVVAGAAAARGPAAGPARHSHRRAHGALPLPRRLPTAVRGLRPGAADRGGRRALLLDWAVPPVLRPRGNACEPAPYVGLHGGADPDLGTEHRHLPGCSRPDGGPLSLLRPHAARQGPTGDGREPAGRAPGRGAHRAVGPARLPDRRRHGCPVGRADRAGHYGLLRLGLPDRPQGLRRRHRRGAGELSAGRRCRGVRRHRRSVGLVLGVELQGDHRLYDHHPRAAGALAHRHSHRGRGVRPMSPTRPMSKAAMSTGRWGRAALAGLIVAAALLPVMPGVPVFWVTLLNNIGLGALVAIGLVVLTGVGGVTSFGQAAFCGFGAFTTAVLTTRYGWSPWATLPVAVAVTASAALLLGLPTMRLSGHYLPLATIAWGL